MWRRREENAAWCPARLRRADLNGELNAIKVFKQMSRPRGLKLPDADGET